MTYDCVVVGRSLAGLVCAVRLRRLGHRVAFVDDLHDGFSAEGIWELPATLVNAAPGRGGDVINGLLDECLRIGAEFLGMAEAVACSDGRVRIMELAEDEGMLARAAIVASIGETPRLPGFSNDRALVVSNDAWSDAPFFVGKPVAVIGSGMRAASEALLLASDGAQVTVLCEAEALDAPRWIAELRAAPSISLLEGVTIEGPVIEEQLVAVRVRRADGTRAEVPARIVFASPEPTYSDAIFGSPEAARECIDSGLVHVAGLAAGLPAWDFDAHLRHAEQVVEAVDALLRA